MPRSRWDSMVRPRSWIRRCGSRSARHRSACDSRSKPSATRRPPARSAGGSPCAGCGRPPSVRSRHERRARPRLAGPAGRTARRGDRGPPDAPAIGRRPGTARARPGRPCRLPSDRRHTDAHARRARSDASPGSQTTPSCGSAPRSALFALGGRRGRRAAVTGLVAVGINSAVVNLPMKLASRRERPDREAAGVPDERHVPMPTSTSFPSGHSASAFAFAGAVAGSIPVLGAPLRGLAGGGRLLARAHGRALPGRRHRRVSRRGDDRRGDRARNACPAPPSRADLADVVGQQVQGTPSGREQRVGGAQPHPPGGCRRPAFSASSFRALTADTDKSCTHPR